MNATRNVELVLEPLPSGLEKSTEYDAEILRTAFGKKNRIMVGQPTLRPFEVKEFALSAKQVEQHRRDGFDLVTAVVTISFVPDFGCKFVAADFSVAFLSDPDPNSSTPRPVVVDMRPRESVRQEEYKSQHDLSAKVSGSVSPGFAKLVGELSEARSFQVGGKTTIRDLYAFGVGGSEAGWRFQASVGHDLAGIYQDLAFAVRRPVHAPLLGEMKLGAEIAVEGMLDRWATLAFGLAQKRSGAERLVQFASL